MQSLYPLLFLELTLRFLYCVSNVVYFSQTKKPIGLPHGRAAAHSYRISCGNPFFGGLEDESEDDQRLPKWRYRLTRLGRRLILEAGKDTAC